jgi:A/G-specific adenine glycosylase
MKTLYFSEIFLSWYYANCRGLPWRSNINPYNVWVAEIIFQQTRIYQGLAYYERFIERFPNVGLLASAHEDEVLKIWQGLGYYSRATNLHSTAKKIVFELNGIFPSSFIEIKKLKGIGDYTAAAIASIAFNERIPAIDGNVNRVLSRLFAIEEPVDTSGGKDKILKLAEKLIDPLHPGDFNQAMMEFGALQCTPRKPNCKVCPFSKDCRAHTMDRVSFYPRKSKKTKISTRYFNYFIIDKGEAILFNKRRDSDIWKNLYDFPMIETTERKSAGEFINSDHWNKFFNHKKVTILNVSNEIAHQLSHQKIVARFYHISTEEELKLDNLYFTIHKKDIFAIPVPKMIETMLKGLFVD